jgi:hypothetical protein
MMEKTLLVTSYSLIALGCMGLGWFGNDMYKEFSNFRYYNGLRFVGNNSHVNALAQANVYDKYSDWICINSKGMTFKECTDTAQHECAHEVFAEQIEDKPELMEKVMEVIGK